MKYKSVERKIVSNRDKPTYHFKNFNGLSPINPE